jgi:hypothetical protein
MKTKKYFLILMLGIFILIEPLTGVARSIPKLHLQVTDLNGKKIAMNELIEQNENVIIVFWDSNNKEHIEYLDQMNDLHNQVFADERPRVIAISSDKYHNPQTLTSYLAVKDWDFEVYVDVNETFKRLNGISDELSKYAFSEDGQLVLIHQKSERTQTTVHAFI